MGERFYVCETISITKITVLQIPILFGETVWIFIEKNSPIISPFCKYLSMTNGEKEKPSPLPADNSSSRVSSGNYFPLLPGTFIGLGVVLFDARHM